MKIKAFEKPVRNLEDRNSKRKLQPDKSNIIETMKTVTLRNPTLACIVLAFLRALQLLFYLF